MVTPPGVERKPLTQRLDSGVDIEAGRISNSGFKPFCKKYKNSQNSICQTLYNAQQNGQTWVFKSNMSASLMSSHHVHSDAGLKNKYSLLVESHNSWLLIGWDHVLVVLLPPTWCSSAFCTMSLPVKWKSPQHSVFLTRMLATRCRFYKYLFRLVWALSQTNMLWNLHCIIYQYMYCDALLYHKLIYSLFTILTKYKALIIVAAITIGFQTTSLLIDWTAGSRKKEICRHLQWKTKDTAATHPHLILSF